MKKVSKKVKASKLSKDALRIIYWLRDHIGFDVERGDIDYIMEENIKSHRQALIEILAPHPDCQLLVESLRLANEADAKMNKFKKSKGRVFITTSV